MDKTIECEKIGIRLIHIFEDEWINKKEIIKSILLNKFRLCSRVYARQCNFNIIKKIKLYLYNKLNLKIYMPLELQIGKNLT